MERMLKGISLDANQQGRIDAVQDFHSERFEDRKEHHGAKQEIMESFLSGEKSKRQLLRSMKAKKEQRLSNKIEGAELWMNFIESLSSDQQDVLFDNIQDFKEERKERKKKRGARE